MVRGKTLTIFLPDGNPRGIKIAEFTTGIIKMIYIPRNTLDKSKDRLETHKSGIYFLIGNKVDTTRDRVYIGAASNCYKRLIQHNKSKDFWSSAIVIVSSKDFTNTHTQYLEWSCIKTAMNNDRYSLENSAVPNEPNIPEPLLADMRSFFESIRMLISSMGHPILDIQPPSKHILYCQVKGIHAEGEYVEDGFLVHKNSECNPKESAKSITWVSNLRLQLITERIIEEQNGSLVFTKNYLFSSPSAASSIVVGYHSNGWKLWRDKKGRTLDDIYRKKYD